MARKSDLSEVAEEEDGYAKVDDYGNILKNE